MSPRALVVSIVCGSTVPGRDTCTCNRWCMLQGAVSGPAVGRAWGLNRQLHAGDARSGRDGVLCERKRHVAVRQHSPGHRHAAGEMPSISCSPLTLLSGRAEIMRDTALQQFDSTSCDDNPLDPGSNGSFHQGIPRMVPDVVTCNRCSSTSRGAIPLVCA